MWNMPSRMESWLEAFWLGAFKTCFVHLYNTMPHTSINFRNNLHQDIHRDAMCKIFGPVALLLLNNVSVIKIALFSRLLKLFTLWLCITHLIWRFIFEYQKYFPLFPSHSAVNLFSTAPSLYKYGTTNVIFASVINSRDEKGWKMSVREPICRFNH